MMVEEWWWYCLLPVPELTVIINLMYMDILVLVLPIYSF